MKYEDKKTLTLSILMIVILAGFSYYNAGRVKKIKSDVKFMPNLQGVELPDLDTVSPEDISRLVEQYASGSSKNIGEVIYADKKIDAIGFSYPSYWNVLEITINEEYDDLAEALFVLQSPDINPSIIVVSKLKANDLDDCLNVIEQIFSKEKTSVNITKKEEIDNGIYLEIDYRYSDGLTAKSKEKIIEDNGVFYLLSAVAHDNLFNDHLDQIDHFINSISIN